MKFSRITQNGSEGIALVTDDGTHALFEADPAYPGGLSALISQGPGALQQAREVLSGAEVIDLDSVSYLPLLDAGKIICAGINYLAHVQETHSEVPKHPTIFARFPSSLIGHDAPIVRPQVSSQLDYEGELAVVIGEGGRHITQDQALDHVVGYSVFNDGTLRDFQFETPQWTVGKNFDSTGAFGPVLVTADELPAGASGLEVTTKLNGDVVQQGNTNDLIYDVATIISFLSEAMTFEAGDVIMTGTPPGVGFSRDPQLFMKAGDRCEVEIERIGVLSNPIVDET